jgi:SAM-dependent methyltransferase
MFGIWSRVRRARDLARALSDPLDRASLMRTVDACRSIRPASCPCCGYEGRFLTAGDNARLGAECPACTALERHRLAALAFDRGFLDFRGKDVLHFAPEPPIKPLVQLSRPASYVTADIRPGIADMVLNLEAIALDDGSIDVVIGSHVLEHVDDRRALGEIFRVLRPGGQLVALVPLVEGWQSTYEDPSITAPTDRAAHFARYDHLRLYGADFRDRITEAGFRLSEFTASPADCVRHNLTRGERIFLGTKPD